MPISFYPLDVLYRVVYSACTLYMLLILFTWLGPWLQIDADGPYMRWVRNATEPFVNRLRRLLPPMGPMDFGPLAALFVLWLVRAVVTGIIAGNAAGHIAPIPGN